jgi:hypothetical protein
LFIWEYPVKRTFLAVCILTLLSTAASAYSPAPSGESLFLFGFPSLISSAASTGGGGLFDAGPYSVTLNPALVAPVQRVSADLGFGMLMKEDKGAALHIAALFPTRWGVWTGTVQGSFINETLSPPGNVISGRAGWAREINEKLYLGASVFAGVLFNYGGGFAAGLDLGLVYRLGSMGFLKDVRASAVFANIGKTFEGDYGSFPSAFTPKAGFAAVLFRVKGIEAGFSADMSLPSLQNFAFSAGAELRIMDMVQISAGWDMNARELSNGLDPHGIFVGASFKWTANTAKSDFLSKQGWQKTDIDVSALWQELYDGIHLVSAGVSAQFGSLDRDAPVIELGDAE